MNVPYIRGDLGLSKFRRYISQWVRETPSFVGSVDFVVAKTNIT